jgi:hypothetical protein
MAIYSTCGTKSRVGAKFCYARGTSLMRSAETAWLTRFLMTTPEARVALAALLAAGGLILAWGLLVGSSPMVMPVSARGLTNGDPPCAFQAITVTASNLGISDALPGSPGNRPVYFANLQSGVITVSVAISDGSSCYVWGGAAFARTQPPRSEFQGVGSQRWLTYPVGTGHGSTTVALTSSMYITGSVLPPYSWAVLNFTQDITPPRDVTITAPEHISATQVPVSWSADDATSGIASYTVEYSSTADTAWQGWLPEVTFTEEEFTAPATETDYIFRVTAFDRVGNSAQNTATTRVGAFRVYLPLTMRQLVWWHQYDIYEPNDSPGQAYGPLTSGQVYEAYIWDATDPDDYYYLTPSTTDAVQITLSHIPANCNYDLYVYYYDYDAGRWQRETDSSEPGNATESATFTPVAGWTYYIRVYRRSGFSSQQTYYLVVTYN